MGLAMGGSVAYAVVQRLRRYINPSVTSKESDAIGKVLENQEAGIASHIMRNGVLREIGRPQQLRF
jgi:hypothetical protein